MLRLIGIVIVKMFFICMHIPCHCEDTCNCEGKVLSAGAVAGIAASGTLLLALPVGVIIGLGVALYGKRRGQGPMYT